MLKRPQQAMQHQYQQLGQGTQGIQVVESGHCRAFPPLDYDVSCSRSGAPQIGRDQVSGLPCPLHSHRNDIDAVILPVAD